MRISADRERCIGAGMCVFTAPALFEQDDEGYVVLVSSDPSPGELQAARDAVSMCPSGALAVSQ